MARQPFFSGNYGSSLAQIDTRPIMQGAAAQAAMYQGLGQNIGGAIEKYQLNKVKREKEESTAMGTLAGMSPEERSQFIQGNPKLEKAVENALSDTAKPADFSMINSGSAPFLAGRSRGLERDLKETQAKSAALALRMAKELEGTTIQLEKDKATISSLSAAIAKETNPQRLKLLQSQLTEAIADLGEGDAERELRRKQRGLAGEQIDAKKSLIPLETEATKTRLGAVKGEVERKTELEQLQLSGAKRAEATAKSYMDLIGGPEGAAAMSMEEKNLTMNNIQSSINYRDSLGKASVLNALAKANAPVNIKKQAAELSAFQGHLLGYKVRDPINGGQISFEKYLELNNSQGEGDYPLTGDNAGTAGRINATFLNSQKQIDDLVKTVEVQAVVPGADGDQSAPAPAPRSTARGGAGLQANYLAAQQANYRRPEDVEYERMLNVWNVTPPVRRGIQPTPPPGYQP